MKILFFAFEFPPLGGAGVQRSIKFAKYLPEYGIQPVVVTTDLKGLQQEFPEHPLDPSLLEQLPANLEIERIPFAPRAPTRRGKWADWRRIYFSLVEPLADVWRPQLESALPTIIQKHQPSAIYVSLPPFCMAPCAVRIARQFRLPLILDFRDAWSQWCVGPYGSWLHYFMTLRLEDKCLRAATRVICTSEQTRLDFINAHPGLPSDRIAVITNGHDSDMDDWKVPAAAVRRPFCIAYAGAFYYKPAARESMMRPWWKKSLNRMIQYAPRREDWLYRSPYFFFKTVAQLLKNKPALRSQLRIRFAGAKPEWIDAQVREFHLEAVVEFVGRLTHPEVLKFQQEADALLLTSSKVLNGRDYSIAGKTFEYLTMKKPIVGFVTEGAQKDLLQQTGMALICDPDATAASAEKLEELIEGKIKFSPNVSYLKQLHRRELTRSLAEMVRAAASVSPGTNEVMIGSAPSHQVG